MAPALATSPIAFKGFMLGYLHKTAADGQDNTPEVAKAKEEEAKDAAAAPKTPAPKETPQPAQTAIPKADTPYSDLGGTLASLWPGAAAGAVGVGGASLGVDALRGKPMNVKRAILLSMLLGIPLGGAAQMGIMGGTDAYKSFGSEVAGAGKQGLADILRMGGKAQQAGANAWNKGKEMAGDAASKVQGAVGDATSKAKTMAGDAAATGKKVLKGGVNAL